MNLKARLIAFLFAGILSVPASTAMACAWSEEWEYDFYRFYEPEFKDLGEFKPFHFTFDRLYDYELLSDSTSKVENLKAWQKYLGGNTKSADIESLVYGATEKELQALKKGNGFASNALAQQWKASGRTDVLDYLILAHQAEPYCLYDDPWGEEERMLTGVDDVIKNAKAGAKNSADPFLKLRYAYQATRLQQYANHPESAIETYRTLALPVASADPLIAEWAACHYAGCLRALEMEAEAAYEFSRVFDLCPSRRIQAWYGWRILSDEIWEAVQAKCKNNHEMATVFFLRGYDSQSDPVEDMRQMQELDPGSKMIEILLLREINKLESDLLGYPFSGEMAFAQRLGSNSNVSDLQNLVSEVITSGKMHDRNVWQLAHIYLYFLQGDFAKASSELAEKQGQLSPEGQLKAKLMDLVFRITATKTVDRSVENTIMKDYTNLSTKLSEDKAIQLKRFRDDVFAWLYDAQGETGKALLARGRGYQLTNTPINLDLVNNMLAFEAKEDKTLYEKELLKGLGEDNVRRETLLEIKGTGLLARNLFPEAIRVFQQLSEGYRSSSPTFALDADPFRPVTKDVVNCDDCGAGEYNKLKFAEAVVELQKKVATDPTKAAEYYMLLGNAYYNTSYFGGAWNAKDYYRSGSGWGMLGQHNEWADFDIDTFDEIVDMSLAKDYYSKSLKACKDKEMAALVAFMIGKCELNQFYIDGAESMQNYYSGFKTLAGEYKKTAVYKDLIKECQYLKDFASTH